MIPSANIIRHNGIPSLPHAFLDTSFHVNQLCKALWGKISMRPNEGHHFFIQLFLHRWITRQIVQEPQQSNGCLPRQKTLNKSCWIKQVPATWGLSLKLARSNTFACYLICKLWHTNPTECDHWHVYEGVYAKLIDQLLLSILIEAHNSSSQ